MIGKTISHYQILEKLGEGGMGVVYKARDTHLDRFVALKILPADKVAVQMADALAAAHEAEIVHRDLKPGNLMVTEKGQVKVLDFGLAKLTEKLPISAEDATLTAKPDTEEGKILGTVAYMSPEQAEGKKLDARSDIFGFGSVLYEMVTGQKAFQGTSKMSTLSAILYQEPKPISTLTTAIPDELEKLISRCHRKDPERRIQHMDDIKVTVADLKEELDSGRLQVLPAGSKPERARVERRSSRMLVALANGILIAVVLAVGAGWWLMRHREAPPSSGKTAERIASLAVKPLDDFSGDSNQAYLSDGMTEALCAALGNISALRVPGRSTVMRYKGGQKSIQEIARELNVDAIVEGSVQRAGNRILVTVQLIEAATDRHLWSTKFERDLSDFFKVQSEVAQAIATGVEARLTPEDHARLGRARAAKPETIEAYLRGMQQWWLFSDEGTTNALHYFQMAIGIEPNYAPAHAGLALAYIQASTWIGLWAPSNGVPQGKAAAQRAIELDPGLAEAYVAMGYARMNFDWDWAGAEKDFKKALELSPRSSLALDGYANYLSLRGRFSEAIAVAKKALDLDPLSPALCHDLGADYFWSGQCDQAIPQFRRALELDRQFLYPRLFLGWCYLEAGKANEALAEFQATKQLAPDWPWALWALGYTYGFTGRHAEALQVLADLGRLSRRRYVSHYVWAGVYLGLGQTNEALNHLDQAAEERDGNMPVLKVDPIFARLRNEPRFQALLKKVGLAP